MITIEDIADVDNCEIQEFNGHTWEKDNNGYNNQWVDLDYPISKNIFYSDLSVNIPKLSTIKDKLQERDLFIVPGYLQYGDYDNSCMVERSNHKLFLEDYQEEPGIFEIIGGYGSTGIAISIRYLLNPDNEEKAQSIIDLLNGLNDYPCLDDEDMSNMEYEVFLESLTDYGMSDSMKELSNKYGITVYYYDEEKFKDILLETDRSLNYPSYMIESGGSCYIDIGRLIEPITLDMLKTVLKDYEKVDQS